MKKTSQFLFSTLLLMGIVHASDSDFKDQETPPFSRTHENVSKDALKKPETIGQQIPCEIVLDPVRYSGTILNSDGQLSITEFN